MAECFWFLAPDLSLVRGFCLCIWFNAYHPLF
jgi:hypothetical protein